jgi:ERCC4-related helicase
MDYKEFIESKKHTTGQFGFEPTRYPTEIFDFQKHIVEKAIRKGRMGIFADTGLGKTRISLTIAKNIIDHTK